MNAAAKKEKNMVKNASFQILSMSATYSRNSDMI